MLHPLMLLYIGQKAANEIETQGWRLRWLACANSNLVKLRPQIEKMLDPRKVLVGFQDVPLATFCLKSFSQCHVFMSLIDMMAQQT